MIKTFDLHVKVIYIPSSKNLADELTRVRKRWLQKTVSECDDTNLCCAIGDTSNLSDLHNRHHVGVDRSWFLMKKVDPTVTRKTVENIVKECHRCQSIDPSPNKHIEGKLDVSESWKRLAIDVTHYGGIPTHL